MVRRVIAFASTSVGGCGDDDVVRTGAASVLLRRTMHNMIIIIGITGIT